ncbi:hypothetical protein SAY87_008645 [Trapa incisa]|uniref:Uncharacterized protein n=1 Tax=Trapa incisa TaxID=236973 RepID=A0AAN7JUQ4_9MYRT|nr:hypothetical protein SAY87_008645 [Trapa incisa]
MGFSSGLSAAPRPCDCCNSASAAVFCRADAAALCFSCDTRIHSRAALSSARPHERVWMCEVCEQAPAAVTCKADAAALCHSCDSDIHSANPLAQRHERLPVQPFFESAESVVRSSVLSFLVHPNDEAGGKYPQDQDAEAETDSWLLPYPTTKDNAHAADMFGDMDPHLDFGSDAMVPVQKKPVLLPAGKQLSEERLDVDFSSPNNPIIPSFSYHSITSSLDAGVVPDGLSNMSDTSYPPPLRASGDSTLANSSSPNQPAPATPLTGSDRLARVMRYREKRKNRQFQKTIRYASRKAYAETRPRIKGRFAKRAEADVEVDGDCFHGAALYQYGVVPTF